MKVVMPYNPKDYSLAVSAAVVLVKLTEMKAENLYLYGSAEAPEIPGKLREMGIGYIRSAKDSDKYPLGPNRMFSGLMEALEDKWREPVFLAEADGFPTCRDWYERVKLAHEQTTALCSGSWVGWTTPGHYNGNMVIDPKLVKVCPYLKRSVETAWDVHYAEVFEKYGAPNKEIHNPRRYNVYYPTKFFWEQKGPGGYRPAWIHGCQGFGVYEKIEREGFGND